MGQAPFVESIVHMGLLDLTVWIRECQNCGRKQIVYFNHPHTDDFGFSTFIKYADISNDKYVELLTSETWNKKEIEA